MRHRLGLADVDGVVLREDLLISARGDAHVIQGCWHGNPDCEALEIHQSFYCESVFWKGHPMCHLSA